MARCQWWQCSSREKTNLLDRMNQDFDEVLTAHRETAKKDQATDAGGEVLAVAIDKNPRLLIVPAVFARWAQLHEEGVNSPAHRLSADLPPLR
jgi:hypothetical protein